MSVPNAAVPRTFRCFIHSRTQLERCMFSTTRRGFASSAITKEEVATESTKASPPLAPALVSTQRDENWPLRSGLPPIGSRRRRAALRDSPNLPFEQLPYQCFQEARKVLAADREEKLKQIELQRARIARLLQQDATVSGGEFEKQRRLTSMRKHLEELKILADINDPAIRKRFQDGEGDMTRPIYRYLADKQWREYQRPMLVQRITQMHVIPDVLPHIDPIADVRLAFGRRKVHPGEFVDSRVSEIQPRLNVQVFDRGERLVSVAVVDSDVPNLKSDGFDYRCHLLAANLPISPTSTSLPFTRISQDQHMILPWLPPFAQKGSPYHRLSVFVLRQPDDTPLDVSSLRDKVSSESFNLRSFSDKYKLQPFGVHMFRTIWDEGTTGVMKRAGVEGADVELHRKRIDPLPYKKKNPERYR